jgi:hypothetical protein
MHYSPLLISAILAALPTVNGNCHGSGETWGGDKFTALEKAQTLCTDGRLGETSYGFGEFKTYCVNLSSKKKADFTIMVGRNVIPETGFWLNKDECTEYLHKEINGCGHGGRTTYGSGTQVTWTFS